MSAFTLPIRCFSTDDFPTPPRLDCSFCAKSSREVQQLIAGPAVFICDECIDECNVILAEQRKALRKKRTA